MTAKYLLDSSRYQLFDATPSTSVEMFSISNFLWNFAREHRLSPGIDIWWGSEKQILSNHYEPHADERIRYYCVDPNMMVLLKLSLNKETICG